MVAHPATLSLRSFFAVGENSIWDAAAGLAETVIGLALLIAACYRFESPAWAMLALAVGALVGLVIRLLSLRRLGIVPAHRTESGWPWSARHGTSTPSTSW